MRIIGWLVGVAGGLAVAGPSKGRAAVVLWLPRLLAQAWSPVIAAAGAVVGSLALTTGRQKLGIVALGGAGLTTRYAWTALGGHRPGPLPVPAGRCRRDLRLGSLTSGDAALGDLWRPEPGREPSGIGIVYLHGGLWQALDKGFCIAPLMRLLTAAGHVALDVAYPLAPGATLEAMDEAVGLAVRWLATEGQAHGVRADRIVLIGHAGGGHLALFHAFRQSRRLARGEDDGPAIRGVVAVSAVTDPEAFWIEYGRVNPQQPCTGAPVPASLRPREHDTTIVDRLVTRLRLFPSYRYGNLPGGAALIHDLFGGTPVDAPDRYTTWSPVALATPGSPPVLQVVGCDDGVIPAAQGRALHRVLLGFGCQSTLVELPLTVHGFDQYPGVSRRWAPAARRTTTEILAFVKALR